MVAYTGVALKDGVIYPEPTHHYETEQLTELHELVEDALQGEEVFEELEDHLEQMSQNYGQFERHHIQPMQELLTREAYRLPDDDYNTKLSYVLRTGMARFHEGKERFRAFFETESDDPEELERAFLAVGDGHDFICLGMEMASRRLAELEDLLAQHPGDPTEEEDEEYEYIEVDEDDESGGFEDDDEPQ